MYEEIKIFFIKTYSKKKIEDDHFDRDTNVHEA